MRGDRRCRKKMLRKEAVGREIRVARKSSYGGEIFKATPQGLSKEGATFGLGFIKCRKGNPEDVGPKKTKEQRE